MEICWENTLWSARRKQHKQTLLFFSSFCSLSTLADNDDLVMITLLLGCTAAHKDRLSCNWEEDWCYGAPKPTLQTQCYAVFMLIWSKNINLKGIKQSQRGDNRKPLIAYQSWFIFLNWGRDNQFPRGRRPVWFEKMMNSRVDHYYVLGRVQKCQLSINSQM